MSEPTLALAVHAGAWWIPDEEVAAGARGVETALLLGIELLRAGASSLEAAVESVAALENDPAFDAGLGSVLTLEGRIEMDASVMDGETLRAGAVGAVERVRNPVYLARELLAHGRHVFLTGRGALEAARRFGLEIVSSESLVLPRERARLEEILRKEGFEIRKPFDHPEGPKGTVGAVARDARGHVAAATSTGGAPGKWPGRLGDSPVLGAGTYADDALGACSATGWGEAILRVLLASDAVSRLDGAARPMETIAPRRVIHAGPDTASPAARAAATAIHRLDAKVEGLGGVILLASHGEPAFAFNTPRMNRGTWVEGGEARVWVDP